MSRVLLAAALAATLPACSGGYRTGDTSSTSASAQLPTTQSSEEAGSGAVELGTVVTITPSGFRPKILVAPMGEPITWRNESGSTQSVDFDNFGEPVDSGPISPGDSWSFNPNAQLSILYHSGHTPRFRGQLQVQLVGSS